MESRKFFSWWEQKKNQVFHFCFIFLPRLSEKMNGTPSSAGTFVMQGDERGDAGTTITRRRSSCCRWPFQQPDDSNKSILSVSLDGAFAVQDDCTSCQLGYNLPLTMIHLTRNGMKHRVIDPVTSDDAKRIKLNEKKDKGSAGGSFSFIKSSCIFLRVVEKHKPIYQADHYFFTNNSHWFCRPLCKALFTL